MTYFLFLNIWMTYIYTRKLKAKETQLNGFVPLVVSFTIIWIKQCCCEKLENLRIILSRHILNSTQKEIKFIILLHLLISGVLIYMFYNIYGLTMRKTFNERYIFI